MEKEHFIRAICNGDLATTKNIITEDASLINIISEDNKSIFELSVEAGFTSIALLLIELDEFDLNHNGHNPLRLAIDLGFIDIAEKLLNKGANPNYRPDSMSSALLLCLEKEYFDLAELMIKKGAEVNIRNDKGWTPLLWASIKGRTSSVEFLLKHNANIHICNNDGWNAITGAYFKKRTDIVDILAKKGAVFSSSYSEAALLSAYDNGYLDTVNTLLDMKVNPNVSDENGSLLAKAIEKGDDKLTFKLVNLGADVNGRMTSSMPLIAKLAENGKNELIKHFLEAGADINLASKVGQTALYMACQNAQFKTVKLLTKHSANINATLDNGNTPLIIASSKGFLSIVQLLIEHNANTELKTANSYTAKEKALLNTTRTQYGDIIDSAFREIAELLTHPGHLIDD